MSDLPYELHEETQQFVGSREWNGLTRVEIIADAIAKEIGLGRLRGDVPYEIHEETKNDAGNRVWNGFLPIEVVAYAIGREIVLRRLRPIQAVMLEPLTEGKPAEWTEHKPALPPVNSDTEYVQGISDPAPPKPEQPKPTIWPKRRHR